MKLKKFFDGIPFPIKRAAVILIGFGLFKLQHELLIFYIGGIIIWTLL
jgi:hypothetical protein